MGKIATQAEAASIGGATSSSTQCSTKAKAEELGCDVSGTYTNSLFKETILKDRE